MSNLVELKKRIESITSTIKVTKVMQMIATSKIAKIKAKMTFVEKYNNLSNSIMSDFLKNTEDLSIMDKYFFKNEHQYKKILLVVMSSDKGTCGAINTNLFKETTKIIKEYTEQGAEVTILPIGKKITKFLENNSDKLNVKIFKLDKIIEAENCNSDNINNIVMQMIKSYDNGNYDSINFIFHKFKNILICNVENNRLLPFDANAINKENGEFINIDGNESMTVSVIEFFVRTKLYNAYISNLASIVSSRMNAMDNATKNGQEIIDDLVIKFNKGRQAHITSELSDIVSGFEAIS